MSRTLTIARRELRSSFDSPMAYLVICLGLALLGFVFFFNLSFFNRGGFWQQNRASIEEMYWWTARILAVFATVTTMRVMAEERRSGTLEMLITLPVKDHQVILGKFLGAWSTSLVLIALTLFYPLFMFEWPWHLGNLDSGPMWSGYLGLVLYSAAAVSIGLLVSSLTESQVIAFFITAVILFFLHIVEYASMAFEIDALRMAAAFMGFEARLAPFTRGLINTRDVVYFLSITIGCLMAAFRALERRKWA